MFCLSSQCGLSILGDALMIVNCIARYARQEGLGYGVWGLVCAGEFLTQNTDLETRDMGIQVKGKQ